MLALTLWQPWASLLVVCGADGLPAKQVETRSWAAPTSVVGQRIAIHAAATADHLGWCTEAPFDAALAGALAEGPLPLGAVVGTAVLKSSGRMTVAQVETLRDRSPIEFAFGWYEAGRCFWRFCDVQELADPVPVRGAQKLWELPAEDHEGRPVLARVLAQTT